MDKKHIILRTFAEKVIAHLWLLTVPRVGIVEFSSLLFPKEYRRTNHRMMTLRTSPLA